MVVKGNRWKEVDEDIEVVDERTMVVVVEMAVVEDEMAEEVAWRKLVL